MCLVEAGGGMQSSCMHARVRWWWWWLRPVAAVFVVAVMMMTCTIFMMAVVAMRGRERVVPRPRPLSPACMRLDG